MWCRTGDLPHGMCCLSTVTISLSSINRHKYPPQSQSILFQLTDIQVFSSYVAWIEQYLNIAIRWYHAKLNRLTPPRIPPSPTAQWTTQIPTHFVSCNLPMHNERMAPRFDWSSHQDVSTATGFPRPIEKPLVPSGIRGPGGCLAALCISPSSRAFGGVPTWFPRLLWWGCARPRPLPRPRPRPFLCPPSFSVTCSSPYKQQAIIIQENITNLTSNSLSFFLCK